MTPAFIIAISCLATTIAARLYFGQGKQIQLMPQRLLRKHHSTDPKVELANLARLYACGALSEHDYRIAVQRVSTRC